MLLIFGTENISEEVKRCVSHVLGVTSSSVDADISSLRSSETSDSHLLSSPWIWISLVCWTGRPGSQDTWEGGGREEEGREGEKTRTRSPYYCNIVHCRPSSNTDRYRQASGLLIILLNIFPAITCVSLRSHSEDSEWLSDDLTICYSQLKFSR